MPAALFWSTLLFCLPLLAAGSTFAAPAVVETARVEKRALAIELERPGTLIYRRRFRVYNQEEGRLQRFPWREGDRVKKGEVLLELDTRLLRSEMRKAEADMRLKKRRLERLEKLARQKAASSDEVAEARTELEVARAELQILRIRLGHARVTAPFDGVVVERLAEPGDVRSRYTHLLTLADPRSLVIRFRLEGRLMAQLEPSGKIRVRWAGKGYDAVITRLFPEVDTVSRLGTVEARFERIPEGARAGDFVRVRLATSPRERLLIPASALRVDRKGEYVFLVKGGKVWRRKVKSGFRFGEDVEIAEGLRSAQEVVVRGFMDLENGKEVTVSPRRHPKKRTAP